MNFFLWNLLLAAVWTVASGDFSPSSFLAGFVLGYFVLMLAMRNEQAAAYFARVPRVLSFAVYYFRELVRANFRVAYDVVSPTYYMKPGVIAVPLAAKTDFEIMLLANLITLTPGSVALDVTPDRKYLYVHVMYLHDDVERSRQEIKDGLERRVLELLR